MTPTPAQRDALTRIADEFAGLAHQIRVLTQPATPAQDAHTPRERPQTRSGGTESGEGGGGAQDAWYAVDVIPPAAFTADDLYAARDRFAREERDALRRQIDYLRTENDRLQAIIRHAHSMADTFETWGKEKLQGSRKDRPQGHAYDTAAFMLRSTLGERPAEQWVMAPLNGANSKTCGKEADHAWHEATTYEDKARGVNAYACTHCGTTKEERL